MLRSAVVILFADLTLAGGVVVRSEAIPRALPMLQRARRAPDNRKVGDVVVGVEVSPNPGDGVTPRRHSYGCRFTLMWATPVAKSTQLAVVLRPPRRRG